MMGKTAKFFTNNTGGLQKTEEDAKNYLLLITGRTKGRN